MTHETVDVSSQALWSPFPAFLLTCLGYGWGDGQRQQQGQGVTAVLEPRGLGGARVMDYVPDNVVAIDVDVDKEEFDKRNGGRPYRRRTELDDHVFEKPEAVEKLPPSFVTA